MVINITPVAFVETEEKKPVIIVVGGRNGSGAATFPSAWNGNSFFDQVAAQVSINLAPDLFGAAIAVVTFVDVLNTMSDPTLPLTLPEWPEWGNPIVDEAAYDYISSYTPYENVQVLPPIYPHVFATTALSDTQVT